MGIAVVVLIAMLLPATAAHGTMGDFSNAIVGCLDAISADETASRVRCPELHDIANRIDYPLDEQGIVDTAPTRSQLEQLQQAISDLSSRPTRSTKPANLEHILKDYQFDSKAERISIGTRMANWFRRIFDELGLTERFDSAREFFGTDANTRTWLKRIFTGFLGFVVVLTLFMFGRTLWRYLDPNLTQQPVDARFSDGGTGADRGGMPLLSPSQIDSLPLQQQPPALLVATLADMEDRELPDGVWKFTNRELLAVLNKPQSPCHRPLGEIVSVAERALYGEHPVTQSDVDNCREAARAIQDLRDAQSSDGPHAVGEAA